MAVAVRRTLTLAWPMASAGSLRFFDGPADLVEIVRESRTRWRRCACRWVDMIDVRVLKIRIGANARNSI